MTNAYIFFCTREDYRMENDDLVNKKVSWKLTHPGSSVKMSRFFPIAIDVLHMVLLCGQGDKSREGY